MNAPMKLVGLSTCNKVKNQWSRRFWCEEIRWTINIQEGIQLMSYCRNCDVLMPCMCRTSPTHGICTIYNIHARCCVQYMWLSEWKLNSPIWLQLFFSQIQFNKLTREFLIQWPRIRACHHTTHSVRAQSPSWQISQQSDSEAQDNATD